MNICELAKLGTRIYNCKRWINYRFIPVFVVKSFFYRDELQKLTDFFGETELRREYYEKYPRPVAQLTRHFFYRGATTEERLRLILDSFAFFEGKFTDEAARTLYLGGEKHLRLWETEFEGRVLSLEMFCADIEMREGTMTIGLMLDGQYAYHINFSLCKSAEGRLTAYIGCHQGSKDGLALNKSMTKKFFGCRPKNLILFCFFEVLKNLGVEEFYAVSNYGHYARNHIRADYKLKVSYDQFWEECRGELVPDKRFYKLPPEEKRKLPEELPTKKRATYRRRYEFLDALIEELKVNMQPLLRA